MSNIMAVLLNGVAQVEYNRERLLPDHQQLYLDKMDDKMEQGIMVDNESVKSPDLAQRTRFVAGNLASAIKTGNESMVAALCAYLATRQPELKQVKIEDINNDVVIDLVFDQEYSNQVAVKFDSLH